MAQAVGDNFEIQLAVFLLEQQPYAVDIEKIKQIIRPLKITKLPKAPDFLEGVVNLRGVVIPVIDLRKRFNLEPRPDEKNTKVIIASVSKKIIGIIVDDVTEVVPIPKNEIQPPPRVVKGVEAGYVLGVCRYKDDILLILNLDEILTAEEKISLSALSAGGTKPRNYQKGVEE